MLSTTALPAPQPVPSHGELPADWQVLVWGLSGGLVLAVVVLFVAAGLARYRRHLPAAPSPVGLPAGAQWKLSDSWATNLAAIVTALAAVAGVFADKLDTVFTREAPVVFAVTTAALLCFAALAPIAYTVCQSYEPGSSDEQGSRVPSTAPVLRGSQGGLYASSFLTLFAVLGSLSSLFRVVADLRAVSAMPEAAFRVGVVLAIALVGLYGVRTLVWAQRYATAETGTPTLIGIVSVTCCAGRDEESVRRFSLL